MAVRLHKKYREDENRFHQVSPFEDRKSYLRLGVTRYFSHYFKAISNLEKGNDIYLATDSVSD